MLERYFEPTPVKIDFDEEDGSITFEMPKAMLARLLAAEHGAELGRKATKELIRLAERLESTSHQTH